MTVYFIQAGGTTGPVKIGYGDAQARLNDCQVGNHLELRIIRQFEGGFTEEVLLHARFEDLWIRGEWHNFSRAMLGDVGLQELAAPDGRPEPIDAAAVVIPSAKDAWSHFGKQLRDLRKALSLTQEQVAEKLGIARPYLASIETGRDIPGRDTLIKIAKFYGISLDQGCSA